MSFKPLSEREEAIAKKTALSYSLWAAFSASLLLELHIFVAEQLLSEKVA